MTTMPSRAKLVMAPRRDGVAVSAALELIDGRRRSQCPCQCAASKWSAPAGARPAVALSAPCDTHEYEAAASATRPARPPL